MQSFYPLLLLLALTGMRAQAQYISVSEPVPYTCPVVCAGGTVTVKIFQIQRLPANTIVNAELSNLSGTFGSGTVLLPFAEYSTNGGNTYSPGPFTYRTDVSDLLVHITIPVGTAAGTQYGLRIKAANGTLSAAPLRCPPNNTTARIMVTAATTPLPAVAETSEGQGQWIGHLYTWQPTITAQLTTPALVSTQSFFASANYKGHALYDPLSIDLFFSQTGGAPGAANSGTSFNCGTALTTNFSMRLRRRETFAPGYYTFMIAGDDGIRFSVDGGTTWVLNSFVEQPYGTSQRSTATANPNGICLSGTVDLVIEYFQRPADARLTFSATRISPGLTQPVPQSLCEGGQANFTYGYADGSNRYRWQVSTDGGTTFTDLAEEGPYSNTQQATLQINGATAGLSGYLYRCLLTNNCLTDVASNSASLTILPLAALVGQPQSQQACPGQQVAYTVATTGMPTYLWQVSTGAGFSDATGADYAGTQTATLTLQSVRTQMNGWQFRCLVASPTCGTTTSGTASLSLAAGAQISLQPGAQSLCNGVAAVFGVASLPAAGNVRWQRSTNEGASWTDVPDAAPYTGATTAQLTVASQPEGVDKALFRAVVRAYCGDEAVSLPAALIRCCNIPELTSIITPNGDELNETFAAISCTLQGFSLKIYNRWGRQVFASTNPAIGWDGHLGSSAAQAGTYFYHIAYSYQGQPIAKRGFIEVATN